MKRIIRCRGISEGTTRNMLSGVTDLCDGFYVSELPYSAQYGFVPLPFGQSFEASVTQGELMLRRELDKGPAVVLGYSGGAALAGNVARDGHPNLLGVGLIADPFQPKAITHDGKFGVAGSRDIRGVPTKWVWNPADMICQSRANSPVRAVADQTARMSLKDPGRWQADLLDRLAKNRWQRITYRPWDVLAIAREYGQAVTDVRGYLDGTQHVGAYFGRRAELARWVMSL